ncbi:MAG: S8 family serine peptidase, partial [Armatimonadetes bacterium]|nr:S8 family serine peptidase [Armatimonadota bacterium]
MSRWKQVLGGLVVLGVLVVWHFASPQSPQFETKIVVLKQKANLATVFGNRPAVKRLLMQTAERSQRELIPLLESWKQQGEVRSYRRFWIINAIAVEGTQQVFQALERHPAVAAIRPNPIIPPPRPIPSRRIAPQQNFTWGLQRIRVPQAWQTFQVQGEGVVVGVIDTGIDPNHPDLRGKLRPVNGWFDPFDPGSSPSDWQGHGTHVSGTIAGGNASGTHIGVAPRATLIVAQLFDEDEVSTAADDIACMQWMLDPDGDPNTDDGADVVNNSWGYSPSHSPTLWPEHRDAINAWIAAKIFPAFSIGNRGPDPRTTSSLGDYPMAFAVGATDINDRIADFSSRGPVFWEGIGEIIKPDVSAPGVDVMSAVPGGGYERWEGTSMACPHVAGTVALMISLAIKNRRYDEIDVDFLKRALERTAVDLGAPGKDNDYGWGRIDAYEALRRIPPPPVIVFPTFAGSTLESSVSEATVGDTINFTVRVVNSGSGDAINVVVTVPNVPSILSPVTVEGGTFDPRNRQIVWTRPRIPAGQSVILRFRADAASEGVAGLVAQVSADNAQTFTTGPVSVRIVSPVDPYEPNNTPASAKSLVGIDILTERAYLAESEDDWFVVSLPEGRSFWVEVRAWQIGSPLD